MTIYQKLMNESLIGAPPMNIKIKLVTYAVKETHFEFLYLMQNDNAFFILGPIFV